MELELDHLIDALPGLVWIALPDGRTEFLNQRWCDYTGLNREQALGRGWQGALHPDDRRQVLERWRSFLESGKPSEAQGRLRRHDGQYRRFLLNAAPIANRSGQVVKWCGINTDVEERLKTEEAVEAAKRAEVELTHAALNNARTELTHVAQGLTLGVLAASIAHEVNQPLTGIIANAGTCLRMLGTNPPNLEDARAAMQRVLSDGTRAAEVITRLRALFARQKPCRELVDLNDAAREVLELASSELQRSQVVLRTAFAQDLPFVRSDRVQLQQVILNLVANATDAMRTVSDRRRDLLVATSRESLRSVRLSVTDSGVGVDPKNIKRLFAAFYTTKSHGLGIGLSISRSIIESHKGRLWASANDGPGATFSFSIPC